MDKWPTAVDSKTDKQIPVNLPTREEIIRNSHLSEAIFDEKKYQEYIQSFENRIQLLHEQEALLQADFDALKPFSDKGGDVYRKHFHLVGELLSRLSADIYNVLNQKDLFPYDKNWFLIEDQVDSLSSQVRNMKYAMANLYSIDTYHSIAGKASLRALVGPGQYSREEIASPYTRTHLAPRQTEEYFASLLPSIENIHSETILTANGMAALTTVLALVKSERNNGKYLIASNSYYEVTKAFEHMLNEVGIKEPKFQPPETLLRHIEIDDPDMIFVEPIQNNPDMHEIDMLSLVSTPTKHDKRFVVIDNTLSGLNLAMRDIVKESNPQNILLFISSLHKMHEQGDDVAPAGVIHVVGPNSTEIESVTQKLRALRAFLGVNITTPSLLLLQKISPDSVEKYSNIIGKNVTALARDLRSVNSPIVKKIVSASENESGASGALAFFIHFKHEVAVKFIDKVLEKAKEHRLQVTARAAFGYRHTSLEIPADPTIVRIAPGVENPRQIEILKQIFREALVNLTRGMSE